MGRTGTAEAGDTGKMAARNRRLTHFQANFLVCNLKFC